MVLANEEIRARRCRGSSASTAEACDGSHVNAEILMPRRASPRPLSDPNGEQGVRPALTRPKGAGAASQACLSSRATFRPLSTAATRLDEPMSSTPKRCHLPRECSCKHHPTPPGLGARVATRRDTLRRHSRTTRYHPCDVVRCNETASTLVCALLASRVARRCHDAARRDVSALRSGGLLRQHAAGYRADVPASRKTGPAPFPCARSTSVASFTKGPTIA
jgi:hypothetical protein